jgi:hypothetical protein
MTPNPRRLAALMSIGLAALLVGRVGAQNQLAPLADLEKGHSDSYSAINKMQTGQQSPTKADIPAMDAEAKWLVYRFTTTPPKMAEYQKKFELFIDLTQNPEYVKHPANREFVRQFNPILVKRFKDVLDQDFQDYRYPILNTAPMLVQAARMRDESVGTYLAEILTDKGKHDAIKLYAARGLREFFPVTPVADDEELSNAAEKRKKREVAFITALTGFIDKKGNDKLPEEEQNAIRFLRRDALESLGKAGVPAITVGKNKVEAPVAPLLLRVLSPKSDLDPAPSLAERIEAAIGVCQMKSGKVEGYNTELGVHLVGLLLGDFATEYNKDLAAAKGAKRLPAELHWKIHSKRLEAALKDLVVNSRGQPAEKAAKQLEDAIPYVLRPMQASQPTAVDQTQLLNFRKMVNATRPASKEVFKGYKAFVVDIE